MWAPRIGKGRALPTRGDGGCEYGGSGGDHRPRVSRQSSACETGVGVGSALSGRPPDLANSWPWLGHR